MPNLLWCQCFVVVVVAMAKKNDLNHSHLKTKRVWVLVEFERMNEIGWCENMKMKIKKNWIAIKINFQGFVSFFFWCGFFQTIVAEKVCQIFSKFFFYLFKQINDKKNQSKLKWNIMQTENIYMYIICQ
mgnify:CR=1 FL=1